MAQQTIGIGAAPNDGTGDTLRDAFDKANDNFTELYPALTGRLLAANNLSDVASAITARANLDVDAAWAPPPRVSGNWFSAHPRDQLANGVALNSARSYYAPFFIPEAVTISDLAARVITASAGGLFGLGIYANNPATNKPTGTVLASLMGLSTTTGNTPVSGTLGAPVAFARGWYWSAHMVDNGTATFNILAAAAAGFPGLIGDATLANIATAAASQNTGYQCTTINYASGFTTATGQTFSVVSASHNELYFKA